MFKVYTQENCPNCTDIKDFLKTKGVAFDEVDVNQDIKARAFMIMNDLETTPAVEVDGNVFGGEIDQMKEKLSALL